MAGRALKQAKQENRRYDADMFDDLVKVIGNNLAALYLAMGKWKAAEALFKGIIETTAAGDNAMATLHSNLGLAYLHLGLLDEAEQWFGSALTISSSRQSDGPDTANILINTAATKLRRFTKTGQEHLLAQAVRMATTAYGIFRTTRGAHHASVAESVCSLAHIYCECGLVQYAEHAHREALALREDIFGPFSTPVAASLEGLAMCQGTTPDGLLDAERLLTRSLDIRKHVLGSQHHTVAGVLQSLALNLAMQGTPDKLQRAEALALQAVQTMRAAMGASSPCVVPCLLTLYAVLWEQTPYRAFRRIWLETQALLLHAAMAWWHLPAYQRQLVLNVFMLFGYVFVYLPLAVLIGWKAGKQSEP